MAYVTACAPGGAGGKTAGVPLLVHEQRLAIGIEAASAELRVGRLRPAEVVDLAIACEPAHVIDAGSILEQQDVAGFRHDDDVVRVLQRRGARRLVDQGDRFASWVVFPHLAEVERAASRAVEVDLRLSSPGP